LSADLVLGQQVFTSNASGATSATMNTPWDVVLDTASDRLYVTDSGNFRVLEFTDVSTASSGASAANIIGGAMGTTATTFLSPEGVTFTSAIAGAINKGIFVADRGNNRVNFYDLSTGIVAGHGAAACYGHRVGVAGDVTSMCAVGTVNDGGTLATNGEFSLSGPRGVHVSTAKKYLYVADTGNNRVAVYDLTSAVNMPSNVNVTTSSSAFHSIGGQSMIDSNGTTVTTAIPAALKSPSGIFRLAPASSSAVLYVVDPGWHRVGVYEVP
jgi:DNA-binding beta-propeller fold protein YncE